ncbi:spore coat protein [Bacillus sp. OxB-1]|uniref:spore coat protein GerQ n=1 Tax=Bacillus sp. (strain OxB-1) TaxID=98228 RepID=UPI000581E90F|nr:spore coat protein GerQ [Bacillus sp. OxB-1]BAQ09848.1 spore coat protein [Bacillus sp. OxB-1]
MVQYYWNPTYQNQHVAPPVTLPGGRSPVQGREESYIENILRLNRGKIGNFHFSFEHGATGTTAKNVRGMVEAAGRDHVILSESGTGHRYLFPMIYFDYAEFDEELRYFNQTP